jgi:hypothetical protein
MVIPFVNTLLDVVIANVDVLALVVKDGIVAKRNG